MCMLCTRRGFLGALGGGVVAGVVPALARAQPSMARSATKPLPERGEFVITNATVLTMDPALGDLSGGSVHVKDGVIVAVGRDIRVPGASVIDATDMIVLPGFIDTHWHLWHTLFRNFAGDAGPSGFFPTITRFSAVMNPEDMYASSLLAASEAINAGITTVHDWCHNIRSRAHADEDLHAVIDTGLRAQWSFGQALAQSDKELIRLADLEAMHRDWNRLSGGGLVRLGMAWRGMFRNEWAPVEDYRTEFDTARRLGIPITVHIGTLTSRTGHIEAHAKAGLLGPDVNIVHACSASAAEVAMVKASGASVSSLPITEMRGGWGYPKLREFLDAGVPVAVGVDSVVFGGPANVLRNASLAAMQDNAAGQSEFRMTMRRALQLATLDAARVMGIDDRTGSLTVGKRADIVMVSTNALNMAPTTDPVHMVLESAEPANIDTVIVDGRILKRQGRLTAIEPGAVIAEARRSLAAVRQRANWK